MEELKAKYTVGGKDLLETRLDDLKGMQRDLEVATMNYECHKMRVERRRREYDMEKTVTKLFVDVKGASKDDKRHRLRETEAMRKTAEAQAESLQAWMLLVEDRKALKEVKDALIQREKHVGFWFRNFHHIVEDDLVRETTKPGGTNREAMRIAGLVCDCGGPNCDFAANVEERQT
ncbi:hypothetical protein KC19_4G119100 [Ceratodon purpureus]|uniref:Uncharacterized protein n=1 Tax=Ceratodon purpureus TaxID=3225 RepID=A0A8T0I9N3_CERPU|nr:hypothetical protein KC19_4G119100 [Ceratodon purpureus]